MSKIALINEINVEESFYYNKKIVQEIFSISIYEISKINIVEFVFTYNAIHFIMQKIIMEKFKDLASEEIVYEGSAFDEYDRENGYEDEQNNLWQVAKENVNRIIKLSRKLLNMSYTDCINTDIYKLIDYIKFEIDNLDDDD